LEKSRGYNLMVK